MALAMKLKALRLRKGKSLQEIADAIGASKTHVWDLETGRSDNPSVDLLTKIATYFHIPIAHLLGENPEGSGEDPRYVAMYRDLKRLSPRDLETIRIVMKQLQESSAKMSDDQLTKTKHRDRSARANLAIEGMHPTAEQDAMFDTFNHEKMSHEDRRRVLAARSRARASKGKSS